MGKKWTYLLIFIFPLYTSLIFLWTPKAKWPGAEDTVYLKGGREIKGFLVEESPSFVTLERKDGSLLELRREDVSRIYRNNLGSIQKIFYFHVPLAWGMLLAFFVTFLSSILFLKKKKPKYDMIAHSSAEVGVLAATLAVLSGSLWAKPAWGVFWTWDPRLTTMLILWLTFVAYLVLRGFVEEEGTRARLSAIVAIVGFADMPFVYLSTHLWRSVHPVVIGKGAGGGLDPKMKITLFSGFFVFSLFLWVLFRMRTRIEELKYKVEIEHEREERE